MNTTLSAQIANYLARMKQLSAMMTPSAKSPVSPIEALPSVPAGGPVQSYYSRPGGAGQTGRGSPLSIHPARASCGCWVLRLSAAVIYSCERRAQPLSSCPQSRVGSARGSAHSQQALQHPQQQQQAATAVTARARAVAAIAAASAAATSTTATNAAAAFTPAVTIAAATTTTTTTTPASAAASAAATAAATAAFPYRPVTGTCGFAGAGDSITAKASTHPAATPACQQRQRCNRQCDTSVQRSQPSSSLEGTVSADPLVKYNFKPLSLQPDFSVHLSDASLYPYSAVSARHRPQTTKRPHTATAPTKLRWRSAISAAHGREQPCGAVVGAYSAACAAAAARW